MLPNCTGSRNPITRTPLCLLTLVVCLSGGTAHSLALSGGG